jgi:hypothetical protein
MAKKRATNVQRVQNERRVKPVRLDLSETDHKRLEKLADERGLNKASYARMAILERMKTDEAAR